MRPSLDPHGFSIIGQTRKQAKEELAIYIRTLCHDPQYDVQRAVVLIRALELPTRLSISDALKHLHNRLAVQRARAGWGAPWTFRQLQRLYYQDPKTFLRRRPRPVLADEIASWTPRDYHFSKPGPGEKPEKPGP